MKNITTYASAIILVLCIIFLLAVDNFIPQPAEDIVFNLDLNTRYDISYDISTYKEANITLIEYVDYECPYCKANNEEIVALLKEYGNGINYAIKPFPNIKQHKNSLSAAIAFECSKKWDWLSYHNLLISADKLGYDSYLDFAKELNFSIEEFNSCLLSPDTKIRVAKEVNDSIMLVRGTPTFLVNGIKLEGYQTKEKLRKIIELERVRNEK